MKTLVQNLTRFGDLLQSQPALAELAATGREIAVVCLENFAGAARLLPEARLIFPLPGAAILAGLAGDWREALAAVTDFAARVERDFTPDEIVNLTPAIAARLLARRLCGDAVRGFGMDALGFRVESTPWAAFLATSSLNRGLSPFNIVDLFRKTAGVGQGPGRFVLRRPETAAAERAEARLREAAPVGTSVFVGFQLGASAVVRQWPTEAFARLGELLWEKHRAVPVLLGSPGEVALAEAYRRAGRAPCLDLVGRTDLVELAAVLTKLRLLVSNDTGTLHLAAGLDVPAVAIFLATAQPCDTGPYRPGCLCLEPDMPCHPCPFGAVCEREQACRRAIPPETVAAAVSDFLAAGQFLPGPYPGARAWLSTIDAAGYMDLRSLSGHDREARAVWLRLERHVLSQFLDGVPPAPPTRPLPPLPGEAVAALAGTLEQAAALLHLLRSQAGLLSRGPRMKDKFLVGWERLRRLLLASPYLAVLGHLWLEEGQEHIPDLPRLLARLGRYETCIAAFSAFVSAA